MTEACTSGFVTCCAADPRRFLCGMSVFFAYGAEVAPKELIALATVLTLEELKGVFLGGVACVDNPFIPGVRWMRGVLVRRRGCGRHPCFDCLYLASFLSGASRVVFLRFVVWDRAHEVGCRHERGLGANGTFIGQRQGLAYPGCKVYSSSSRYTQACLSIALPRLKPLCAACL